MREQLEERLRALARRAGVRGAPPSVVGAVLALSVLAVAVALWRWWPAGAVGTAAGGPEAGTASAVQSPGTGAAKGANPQDSSNGKLDTHGAGAGGAGSAAETLCVYVTGAVRHPGLYVLSVGSRVGGAVEAAGGQSSDAAGEAINLAAKVQDGQQIVVPTQAEVAKGAIPVGGNPGSSGSGAAGGASTAGGASALPTAKVNINTSDAAALDALPGVGPSTAAKIVADREANGSFKSPGDLGRVPGIGPKKLEQLKPMITVQ